MVTETPIAPAPAAAPGLSESLGVPAWDFHVHTHHSGCCKEDYDILDAIARARERGCAGIGVSDHCNYKRFNASFVFDQKRAITKSGLRPHARVGLEITILDPKGRLGVHPKYLEALDYYIISEHLHIAKLFSPFFRIKHKIEKWYAAPTKYQAKIRRFHARYRALTLNAIEANPRTIFAHAYRFPRKHRVFDPVLLELAEDLADAAQAANVAIEVHSGFLAAGLGEDTPHAAFVREFFKICTRYDLAYALGSDAHNLANVGRFPRLAEALHGLGVSPRRLITPAFFEAKT